MPTDPKAAKPEPLFALELGANGGRLAPTSYEELANWLRVEKSAWHWLVSLPNSNHEQLIREAFSALNQAEQHANEFARLGVDDAARRESLLQAVRNYITDVYTQKRLPHTSTALFKKITAYKEDAGPRAASMFVSVHVRPSSGYPPQPQDFDQWRGVIDGILDRYPQGPKNLRLRAIESAFEETRGKAASEFSESSQRFEALNRQIDQLHGQVKILTESQSKQFLAAENDRANKFVSQVAQIEKDIEALKKTYREELSLRAPAEYWRSKRNGHLVFAIVAGIFSFASIGACAYFLSKEVHALLLTTQVGSAPEAWKVAVLALLSLFSIWAVRLVVRLFLSHLHLATDASERIVMLSTYLSLQEGNNLSAQEDRQLILQALFRPTSDGIVKDEGVPPSFLEVLSRNSKN
jgi:hypothetical protein